MDIKVFITGIKRISPDVENEDSERNRRNELAHAISTAIRMSPLHDRENDTISIEAESEPMADLPTNEELDEAEDLDTDGKAKTSKSRTPAPARKK